MLDGFTYIAFRGTDTSIVGWRKDFIMSFAAMPSHPGRLRSVPGCSGRIGYRDSMTGALGGIDGA
ncbi:Mbeg1-like protein [Curtobacterium sp. MCBD17_023]|uniref:Mbeg1-like protein n=1 Tax=Curtobacterium sp. MCBD17_023 TaxID=2175657 RepID=UPI000D954A14|nr:hypothetical protein DEI84_12860 [Curtobacterium sp. MCBD17_023]